jgi:hypothetical protein
VKQAVSRELLAISYQLSAISLIFLVVVWGLSGAFSPLGSASSAPVWQTPPDPARRFGVIGAYDDPSAAAELGIGWEQITFAWAAFQPDGPDDFVTESVDPAWLVAAGAAGREVVGLITAAPAWASDSGDSAAVPDGLDLPVRNSGNVWAAFVTRLAQTYAPQGVHRWVIYEEPNVQIGEGRVQFAGGVEDYARMLRAAYLAATAVDPQAQIHIAGMNSWVDAAAGREPYLARLLAVLRNDMDAPAYGYYFDVATARVFDSTQAVWDHIVQTRAMLENAGLLDKPIWLITNAGPTRDPQESADGAVFGITPDQQADFIVQAAAISYALGVERLAIDRLVDDFGPPPYQDVLGLALSGLGEAPDLPLAWGLIRADGSRRPAFEAYRAVIELFAPTAAVVHYPHMTADLIILEQADRDVYVMWACGALTSQFVITSGAVGERAMLYESYRPAWQIAATPEEWPAAFMVTTPAAQPDANGFLTVAGSPRLLALDRGDFFRVVYLDVAYDRFRLK